MIAPSPIRRPTRKEIALYYKTHRSQFHVPEQIHVFHIVKNLDETADREAATAVMNKALADLDNGALFTKVADRYSDCAGNGGDLGWVERGIMVEEFEDVVFDLPLNKVSPIFESRFGFHIALVTEKRGPGILPMGVVYDQIAEFLLTRRSPPEGAP
jgi:peptidyl-prolyl cis-trans isomerase C